MGAAESRDMPLLQKRRFTPDERKELRRNMHYNPDEELASGIEHAAEHKYDYLIIFPVVKEGKQADGSSVKNDTLFKWEDAKSLWYNSICGDDREKEEAITQLRAAWIREFVSVETVVSFGKFVELLRNSVIELLSQKSGLQLRRTRRRHVMYYRVRAPIRLLEQHAVAIGYRLQLRGEVDPGPEFWNDEEVAEDGVEYSRDKAEEILEELFHVGKIAPNDLTIFDDEVLPKQWSRRLHTLERIADRVPVSNRYRAYTPLLSDPTLRHLYQTYPSVRGRTLFKAKDRLYLTRSILRTHVDFGLLEAKGVVLGLSALHDASRGERVNADSLLRRWVTPWREHGDRVGAPCVTDPAMEEGHRVSPLLLPWSQPLEEVRDYFGEKIAMYFAWLGFYAYALILPALVGLALQVYVSAYLEDGYDGVDWAQVLAVVLMCVWSSVYKRCWDRELHGVALKWGMDGFQDSEASRPNFVGDVAAGPDNGRRRSPVTNRVESYYPPWKRAMKQAVSVSVILACVGLVGGIVEGLMWAWAVLDDIGFEYSTLVVSVVIGVEVRLLSNVYKDVAVRLNDWENHRTDTDYEDALIFKTFFFQVVNNYGALLYVAFVKASVYGCSGSSCMADLQTLTIVVFLVRLGSGLLELLEPLARRYLCTWGQLSSDDPTSAGLSSSAAGNDDASSASSAASLLSTEEGHGASLLSEGGREEFEAEVVLDPYDGPFDDYAEMMLQYGYVTMFLLAFPLVPLLALVECLLQMRVDAYKLLRLHRRPEACPAQDIGLWSSVVESMGYLAVLTNVAILCFTTPTLHGYDELHKWLIFLVAEQGLMLIKFGVTLLLPDTCDVHHEVKLRNRFVITKHIYGSAADDASAGGVGGAKSIADLDVDSLSLENVLAATGGAAGARAAKGVGEREALERRRREIERELCIAKDQLQQAMHTEVYNDKTGVGETKYGLPLGFINVHLLALEGVTVDKDEDCLIVISTRSTTGDPTPPGPPPKHSNPARRGGGADAPLRLEFNQSFQLAPIRTQDAELILDVLDRNAEPAKIGTVRVELRELASQETESFHRPLTTMEKASGKSVPVPGALYFTARFQYSKVVPLRKKVYLLADQKRAVEKQIALLTVGRLKR